MLLFILIGRTILSFRSFKYFNRKEILTRYPHTIEDEGLSMLQRMLFAAALAYTPIELHTRVVFRRNNSKLHVELGNWIESIMLRTISRFGHGN